ncbi:unnamed protein product [Trichobilharzia szidati]|nr:unnamed protein product [Trichobilharzia szidati]
MMIKFMLTLIFCFSITANSDFDPCIKIIIGLPNCISKPYKDQSLDPQTNLEKCKQDPECSKQYVECAHAKLNECNDEMSKEVKKQLQSFGKIN